MQTPSEEQQRIIDAVVLDGANVIVDAVAGSGKSTTVLSIAAHSMFRKSGKRILQVTYNSMLRHELREKIAQHDDLSRVLDVHTFHSLAVRFYDGSAHTDNGLRLILSQNKAPRIRIPRKDVLVIDECQDMTLLYYQFLLKFMRDAIDTNPCTKPFQLVILGDYMQGLYEFKGADTRFLTLADQLWNPPPPPPSLSSSVPNTGRRTDRWIVRCGGGGEGGDGVVRFGKFGLRTSYRITRPMAYFVNEVMLGESRLEAVRPGQLKVHFIRCPRAQMENAVLYHIRRLLGTAARPDDIFVLGASVKGERSPIRRMENLLVQEGIPCYVPMIEHMADAVDEKVIQGKIVFSTFHACKGRQRKFVFVLGFDDSYMRFFAQRRDECPSTLYVAATRAMEGLFLLEKYDNARDRPLRFLKKDHMEIRAATDHVHFDGQPFYDWERIHAAAASNPVQSPVQNHSAGGDGGAKAEEEKRCFYVSPTELVRFISEPVMDAITPYIDQAFTVVSPPKSEINIPSTVQTDSHSYEEVSDLNGIALPCMYFDRMLRQRGLEESATTAPSQATVLHGLVEIFKYHTKPEEHFFLKQAAERVVMPCTTIRDYLYLANVYEAFHEKLYFKLRQIDFDEGYHWITEDMVAKCMRRMDRHFGCPAATASGEAGVSTGATGTTTAAMPQLEKTIISYGNDTQHEAIDAFLVSQNIPDHFQFRFQARCDVITRDTVWELKCVKDLSIDHKLQVIIYAWLWKMLRLRPRQFRLFNIRNDEILELTCSDDVLDTVVLHLLQGKYSVVERKSDADFLTACHDVRQQIWWWNSPSDVVADNAAAAAVANDDDEVDTGLLSSSKGRARRVMV